MSGIGKLSRMTSLEALAERALRSARDYRFHHRHRSQAVGLLSSIEKERGETDRNLTMRIAATVMDNGR